ncbi:MAG: hypothetical protein ACK5Y2_08675 [Bdellovibrionales bacterium]
MKTVLSFILLAAPLLSSAAPCSLTIVSQSQFDHRVHYLPEIRNLSKTANHLLKKTFETAEKVDDVTLGLVSAVTMSYGAPLEQLRPEVWDRLSFAGSVVYEESPFARTSLKGVKLSFSSGTSAHTTTTGTRGEFAESFSKIVPYQKLRLLPYPFFYKSQRSVPTVKLPLSVAIETPDCVAKTQLDEISLEPLLLVVRPSDFNP